MISRGPAHASRRRWLLLAVAGMVLLALLPARFTGFLNWFANRATDLTSPIHAPIHALASWIKPAAPALSPDSPQTAQLLAEIDQWKRQVFLLQDDLRRLRAQSAALQRLTDLNIQLATRQITAPVIGVQPDFAQTLLKVRAGSAHGVTDRAVAVFQAVHLVGQVRGVSDRTCMVLPLTDRGAGRLQAVIFTNERLAPRPGAAGGALDADSSPTTDSPIVADQLGGSRLVAALEPTGRGTLRGPVGPDDAPGATAATAIPEVGMIARLRDDRYPRDSWMLIVGVVERVDLQPSGRAVVTVRPMFVPDRLGELTLRLPADPAAP